MDTFTIIGLIAATCTTLSFVPQAVQTIKTKDTKSLSLPMYSVFTFGVSMWLVYGIMIQDLPIIVANLVTVILTATILGMKLKYK